MSATPSGTRAYFEKLKRKFGSRAPSPRVLGKTDLQISCVGFGGYRVNEFDPDHREALRAALLGGCNLIDTSTNYGDGSSERLIGQVLSELFETNQLAREEVVVVTKAGYVQGANLKDARARAGTTAAFNDMVEFQSDCWHCISPDFLEQQITLSLERLKIDAIDVLLLHNPEYFLKAGGSRETYYQRLDKALRYLETECQRGRIKSYGISSNTFVEDEARSDFTSLRRILQLTDAISARNGFAVIQAPFNLFEPAGALLKNNDDKTLFELAASRNLGVLVNRPLNAFGRGRLIRLTSFPHHDELATKSGIHLTLSKALDLEKAAPLAARSPQSGHASSQPALQWAHFLRERLGDLDDLLLWREALYHQILPAIRHALERLPRQDESTERWANEYRETMNQLLRLVTASLENLAHEKSKIIENKLSEAAPELRDSPNFSQKVLRLYGSIPEISAILVGMRTPAYVEDTLAAATAPKNAKASGDMAKARALEVLSKFQPHRS